MRRRDVNWKHQQSFHVSAVGLVTVILSSMPSASAVKLVGGVWPGRRSPTGQGQICFQIPFQCCSCLGLLPHIPPPPEHPCSVFQDLSFASWISRGPCLPLFTYLFIFLLVKTLPEGSGVNGSQSPISSPAHSSSGWLTAGALESDCQGVKPNPSVAGCISCTRDLTSPWVSVFSLVKWQHLECFPHGVI